VVLIDGRFVNKMQRQFGLVLAVIFEIVVADAQLCCNFFDMANFCSLRDGEVRWKSGHGDILKHESAQVKPKEQ
jgi:hypothetical protein